MTGTATQAAGNGRPRGAAAFDFDGTLVPGDSLGPFLVRLHGRQRAARLAAEAAPAMLVAYRSAGRDGAKAALLRRAMTGLAAARVADEGARYGRLLARRVRPAMARRLEWHRQRDHRLLVVSASLAAYLEPFGQAVGMEQVIATRLAEGPDGRLTGQLFGANVRGPEKAARLRQALGTAGGELWAYGDSAGDREMLAMADHPVVVRSLRVVR